MKSKGLVYKELESKMLRYADLVGVPVLPTPEALEIIKSADNLVTRQIDERMLAYTGKYIVVRKQVVEILKRAAGALAQVNPDYELEVVYGYRALQIQTDLFNFFQKRLAKKYKGAELMEVVHRLIAVPEVSGHPTGGAVDAQILYKGKPVDMGTKIWEFTEDSYSFSPFVSQKAQQNRQILRKVMMAENFAPFDGEWWHYSYGDREWAKYYNQSAAIYEQVDLEMLNISAIKKYS
jgi:zinc D-Ala-D-Ala dipeptidase